jgi:saccharopine dehydrogenase (NADP+, L-glutamate forming)
MGEIGLDPGIDHMSAMEILDRLKGQGAEILSFKSYTGGLVAPASNDNPWQYKISWNPRNVVLAGQGIALYKSEGQLKVLPYQRLFSEIELLDVPGIGQFDAYANRDSLSYETRYRLDGIPTLLRATLRYPGYCTNWNALVKLGCTDDTTPLPQSEKLRYCDWTASLLPDGDTDQPLRNRLASALNLSADHPLLERLEWLGLLSDENPGLAGATSAQFLQSLMMKRWAMKPHDQDRVVMHHAIRYRLHGQTRLLQSTFVMDGANRDDTAMARTVGLPMGIFVRLLLSGKFRRLGVMAPLDADVYQPVLHELQHYGVSFEERDNPV